MRISDWSSDVCSSDLPDNAEVYASVETVPGDTATLTFLQPLSGAAKPAPDDLVLFGEAGRESVDLTVKSIRHAGSLRATPIGRASGKARVWPYVLISVGAVYLIKKTDQK